MEARSTQHAAPADSADRWRAQRTDKMGREASDFAAMRDAFRHAGLCTEATPAALVESWCARRDDDSDGDSLYVPSPQRVKIRRRLAEACVAGGVSRVSHSKSCERARFAQRGQRCDSRARVAGARPPALAIDTNLNKAMGAGSSRSKLLWTVQTSSLLQEL